MSKTIIIESLPFEAESWQEAPIGSVAGWAPEEQVAHEAEMLRQGIVRLRPGEVSFRCVIPHREGTTFTLEEDGRAFVVTYVSGKEHRARET